MHPVPVFPLPGVVLFPRAVLPLHVFEHRYRTLVRDALRGERLVALTLLRPGWEREYRGSPGFFPLGCLARFEQVEWLPDDCYDLKVAGLSRVRIERLVREFPYRTAAVRLLPQEPVSEDDPLTRIECRALLDAYARLLGTGRDLPELAGDLALEALVNTMCTALPGEPLRKLSLLELDSLLERARRVRREMEREIRRPFRALPGEGGRN